MAKGHENLIPLNKRSKEAQRKIQSMGGKACREKNRKKKSLKELTLLLLENPVVSEEAKAQIKLLFPNVDTEDLTNGMAMTANILLSAITSKDLKEKVKAAEYLRDTAGQKPETSVTGSVTVEKVFVSEKEQEETLKHIKKVITGENKSEG